MERGRRDSRCGPERLSQRDSRLSPRGFCSTRPRTGLLVMAVGTSTTLRFAMLLTAANGFLDAYTYIIRGGVFANVQTGNVIFFAVDLAYRRWGTTLAHLWPIFAFLVGVLLSAYIKSGRVEKLVSHPLRWTMGIQAVAFAVFGFV